MPHLDSASEPWRSFLRELDEAVAEEVRLICMGGFVVTQLYGFSRSTADIDALSIVPRDQAAIIRELGSRGGPLYTKHKVYLDFVAVACVPEDYEGRLTEMYLQAFRRLRLFAPDPYDLALSKLASFCNESQNSRIIKEGFARFFSTICHFSLDKYVCFMAHITHGTY